MSSGSNPLPRGALDRTWTYSDPIIFAPTRPCMAARDTAGKKGDQIVLAHNLGQRRSYAARPSRPPPSYGGYSRPPPNVRRTRAFGADISDFVNDQALDSWQEEEQAKAKAEAERKRKDEELKAKAEAERRRNEEERRVREREKMLRQTREQEARAQASRSVSRSQESHVPGIPDLPAHAPKTQVENDDSVPSSDADFEKVSAALDDSLARIKTLQEQLSARDKQLEEKDKETKEREGKERTLQEQLNEVRRQAAVDLEMHKRYYQSQVKKREEELAFERFPISQQKKLLTQPQEEKAEREAKERMQKEKRARADARGDYEDYREMHHQASLPMNWLHKSATEDLRVREREVMYWKRALQSYESFVESQRKIWFLESYADLSDSIMNMISARASESEHAVAEVRALSSRLYDTVVEWGSAGHVHRTRTKLLRFGMDPKKGFPKFWSPKLVPLYHRMTFVEYMPELFKRLSGRRAQVEVQLESAKGDDKERLLKLWKTIKRDKSIVAHTARVIQQVSAIRDLHYLSEAPLYEQEAFRRMRQVRTGFAKVLKKATSFDARLLEKEDEYYNTQKAFSTLDEAVFRRALVEERMGALAKDEKAIKKFIDDCIVDAYEAIDKVVRGLGGYGSFTHNAVSVNRSPAVSSYFNHSSNKSSGKYRKAPLMPRNPTIQKHSSRSVSPLSSEASHKPTSRERRLARWKFARAEASPTPPPDDVNSGGTHQGTVGFKPTAPMRQAITAQACEVGAPEDPASDQMSSSNISELATESELEEKREEDVVHLTYQIPPDDLKRALVSSKSSRAAYWKYTLYKGPNGMAPRRFLAHKKDDAEEKAQLFKNEKVLGFDIEWEAYAKLGVSSIKDNVSLVQIACEDKIALFQLAAFQGDAIENLMPPTLRHILESPDIIKAGVNIASDFTRLRQCLDIQGQGIFELSHLYKIVKWSVTEPKKVNKKPCKLADQVEDYLFLPLAKGAVRTSAWSKPLYVEQQEYAANDAYAGFRLFHALEAKRRDMDPTPPRPACYEENKPLVLGNGQEVASRVKAAAKSSGVARAEDQEQQGEASATAAEAEPEVVEELVDEDNDETEDYVDAVEVQPTSEEADATCGTAIEYPTLAATHSSALDDNLANAASSPAAPLPLLHDSSPDALAARQNPNLPLHLSRNMYAYTLWHDQSLSINQIAALLRDPPLQRTTVASCILEAIKASGNELPFDVERMREVLKCIPPAGHARYNEVLMRLVTM